MSKLNNVANIVNATQRLNEVDQQVNQVKNSHLTENEKQKALKSHNKMVKAAIVFTISSLLLAVVICFIILKLCNSFLGLILCLIVAIMEIVSLVLFAIFKDKVFSDWSESYSKVNKGFDGLTEEEINKLKPQPFEEKIIKTYKTKSIKYGVIFLIALVIEFSIILGLGVPIYSPITIIITVVITIIWYVKEDSCQVEIHRLESGYYKKDLGFICDKCKTEVKINFDEIEKYDSLPRNESGIRVMSCPKCNNPVPFYNFDITLKDYKKYLEKLK